MELYSNSLFSDAALQLYCRLTSSAADSSPNGYNLIPNAGSPDLTYAAGKFGNAVFLTENTNNACFVKGDPNCANLEIAGSQTWAAWVKPTSHNQDGHVLAKWSGGAEKRLYCTASTGVITFQLEGLSTNASVTSNSGIGTGSWVFVCGVYDSDNSKLKIWVNSTKKEVTASGSSTDTDGTFALGRNGDSGGYFDGGIDDAYIFNRALTDAEVSSLYSDAVATALKDVIGRGTIPFKR